MSQISVKKFWWKVWRIICKINNASGKWLLFFAFFIALWFIFTEFYLKRVTAYGDFQHSITGITTITSISASLTNIFIFGIFTIKANSSASVDYKIVYYTIATFKKMRWVDRQSDFAKKYSISKYSMLSIYTHISFLLIHVTFAISSSLFPDLVVFIFYLLLVFFLTIKFIFVFSKTFVVRSERMKVLNTLVYIRMAELFIFDKPRNLISKKECQKHFGASNQEQLRKDMQKAISENRSGLIKDWDFYFENLDFLIKEDFYLNPNFWKNNENFKSDLGEKQTTIEKYSNNVKKHYLNKFLDERTIKSYIADSEKFAESKNILDYLEIIKVSQFGREIYNVYIGDLDSDSEVDTNSLMKELEEHDK